jgi:RNA polymerase sigma-70 factor (ECF subfamily)
MQKEEAEDLVQDVLTLLHTKYGHVDQLEELLPLSLQILRFKILAFRRKAARHRDGEAIPIDEQPIAFEGPDPESLLARRELLDRLQKALEGLGDRCRELFRLKLLGKSFVEIQTDMKASSINTVYTWDLRCRKALLEALGGAYDPRLKEKR